MAKADHRRAIAERNAAAILDAIERLSGERAPLSMSAVAAEAGVSRPTIYARFKTLSTAVEAAVERAVRTSVTAVEAAEPGVGPADEALRRMLATSWGQLARQGALARAVAEHLPPDHLHRTHAPLIGHVRGLVERGQRAGVFRTDLPADWLVTMFYGLVHSADEHARALGLERSDVLEMLEATVCDLFDAGRPRSA